MKRSTVKKIRGAILLLALALLSSVAVLAWERAQDKAAYEALAAQRAEQEALAAAAASDPALRYIYKENKNLEWLEVNPDFVGWLRVPGTRIDCPVVRGNDNAEYLTKDFQGGKSAGGSIFMDYRNLGDGSDRHTLIYGHTMKNKTMFHDLVYYHDPGFLAEHPVVQLSSLYGEKEYRIFSVYEISADDYAFTLDFPGENDFASYLEQLAALSVHGPGAAASARTDPPVPGLLTLVTCSYGVNNGRTVVHAIEVL